MNEEFVIEKLNDNIIDNFSIEELEERLEMSIITTTEAAPCDGTSCHSYMAVGWTIEF